MDPLKRRQALKTDANPDSRMDYVSMLEGRLSWNAGTVQIMVRYVPDRLILKPDGLGPYLETLGQSAWPSLEALATAILDDLNNEVVARWVQVIARESEPRQDGVEAHSVMLEDRQPTWENTALLSRLRLI